jgi:nicotinamide N-methyltransferase
MASTDADTGSSIQALFQIDSTESDACEIARYETIGDVTYELWCAPNDGSSPGSLFAYTVWSGSIQVADHLAKNPALVVRKRVIEFGAAAALPSLVALNLGAEQVVTTDYPNENILGVIRRNISANLAKLGDSPVPRSTVVGHLWGSTCPEEYSESFDVALVAECLWKHAQHISLLESIGRFLRPGGTVVLSYAHHIPGLEADDDAFFFLASAAGFTTKDIEARSMRQMWDADKTTTQYLKELVKGGKGGITSAAIDAPAPHDSDTLATVVRARAQLIAAEEEAARASKLVLPVDKYGAALPVTMPGPRAPSHEDHPAYGIRMWPPPAPAPVQHSHETPEWANAAQAADVPEWARF